MLRLGRLSNALQQRVTHLLRAKDEPTTLLISHCSRVRSQTDAEKTSHLIVTHLPHVPPHLRPPILILAVHLLSAYRVFPPLERVVKLFIGLPIFHENWHFNSLLRALTHSTNSPTDGRIIGRLAVLLLKTMTERELSLTKRTYRFLLQNRYVTMELTEELRQRMIRDNIVPDRAHLESLLRIFASSAHHDAASYAHAAAAAAAQTPSGTPAVEYLSQLVHENAQRGSFNADVEWARFLKTGHSHRFSTKRTTSAATWAARLMSLSRTRTFSPESLVAFFEWSHAHRFPFRTHTTLSYTIVLHALLRKGAYTLALDVWERFRARRLRVDAVVLAVGVEVLTRSGHAERALALLDEQQQQPVMPPSVTARFMRALSNTNPSSALILWDHMRILYGTLPDAHIFTIMLDAARHATLNGDSFAGAIQELGLPFRMPFPHPTPPISSSLDKARRTSYETLRRSLTTTNQGDMWGSQRAWRRAYRLFTNALLAAWPALADVRAPAYAMRASGDSAATAPLRDLGRFLIPRTRTHAEPVSPTAAEEHEHEDEHGQPPLLPVHAHGAAYCPSFVPDDATFRAAILLLGTARSASDIPLLLARMRALDIVPRKRTLAYALVFWAEVSVGAPLLERLQGGSSRGEYVRLVRWLEEWVGCGDGVNGVNGVPDEADIGEAMRKVDAMRRRRQQQKSI